MYRLIGDNHTLSGLPYSAQVFLRALDGIRNELARAAKVSSVELSALGRIAEESAITSVALAEHLALSPSATDPIIDALAESGLLLRKEGVAANGPAVLELTPTGHVMMEGVYRSFQSTITAAADSLDAERLFVFDSALLKMARKLDAAAADPTAQTSSTPS